MTPDVDWFALSPILSLLAASGIALLGAVLVPRALRKLVGATATALGFAGGVVFAALVYAASEDGEAIIEGIFARDRFAALAQ
ncbi:MAG: hypothetical protein H0V85_03945, partial [Thermoleophilaceae bacterium]|nr:hypothetical protein [Thermoleophilaceae bacterium]